MSASSVHRAIVVLSAVLVCLALAPSTPASAVPSSLSRTDFVRAGSDYVPYRDSFRGWIRSSLALCLPSRSARLMEVTPGPDVVVATGITDRFGMVEFAGYPHPRGRYYVEFSGIFRYDGWGLLTHCRPSRSPAHRPR